MSLDWQLRMNPIDVDELFKRKSFNNTTDSKIQVASAQLYQDVTLKVNDQTEDASVIYQKQDTIKELYAMLCDTVDAEVITEEARKNTDKHKEEESFHPDDFTKKQVEDAIELSKEKISIARDYKGNYNTSTALTSS